MTRILLALGLLSLAACRDAPDPVAAPGPQPGVDLRTVQAEIDLDPDTCALDALATLDLAHPDTLRTLVLGLDDALEVQAVSVDGAGVLFWREGDALHVPLDGPADSSRVVIAYSGTPASGLYTDQATRQRVTYTDGWPDRTAGWLPAVHHPSDPARFDLALSVPADRDVVASGRLVRDSVAGDRRHVRFVLGEEAPPYTWAFAVGDYAIREQSGPVPIRHAVLAGDAALASRLSRTPDVIAALAARLGPYPYETYATVQVPMEYAGMENAAAPFLRASLYTVDAPGRNAIEEVNIHEVVHQWWGNAVVPADWRDLWLAEGPATYLTAATYEWLDGWDTGRRHLVLMAREIGPEDAARALVPATVDDPDDVLTPTVYNKGGAVMHLLRLTLGEEAFWGALRRIQTDFADRPLSTGSFQAALEAASGRDLDAVFQRWVWGDGLPTLEVRWDRATRTLAWEIRGDGGTLDGVPFELYVRQGGRSWFVPATDGVLDLPGDATPEVEPAGILLAVDGP